MVYGLSLGNHALTLLLAPGIAVYVLLVSPRILWRQWRLVLACVRRRGCCTTVIVYAYLPAPLGHGPAARLRQPGHVAIVLVRRPGRTVPGLLPRAGRRSPTSSPASGTSWFATLGLPVILALAGPYSGIVRHPRLMALTALWFVCSWVFALGYPNASIERYYLVPLLVAALVDRAGRRRHLGPAARPAAAPRSRVGLPGCRGAPRGLAAGGACWGHCRGATNASMPRMRPSGASGSRRPSPRSSRTQRSSRGGPTRRRCGTGAGSRAGATTSSSSMTATCSTMASARPRTPSTTILGERPTYIIRLDRDLPKFEQRYVLERIESVPARGVLYRVLGLREEGEPSRA